MYSTHHGVIVLVLWTYLVLFASQCQGHTNLFMDERETKRLLGITAELYYVRNGVINTYALSFNIPLKKDVDSIYFTWHSSQPPATDHVVYYTAHFTVSDERVMTLPLMNITQEGVIPVRQTTFRVYLPCTGHVTGEVEFRMQLNMTIASATNITTLDIRRRKTCEKVETAVTMEAASTTTAVAMATGGSSSASHFYIAMGCVCGSVLVVVLIITLCFVRSQHTRHISQSHYRSVEKKPTSQSSSLLTTGTVNSSRHLRPATPSSSFYSGVSQRASVYVDGASGLLMRKLGVPRSRLTLGHVLMEGVYGRVYHGVLLMNSQQQQQQHTSSCYYVDVLVKTVTEKALASQVDELARDVSVLCDIRHPNIATVMAACRADDNANHPFLMYHFMDGLNLKLFLLDTTQHHVSLQMEQLLYMTVQIAAGIHYLHSHNIVHTDIAARNCLVNSALAVKLTDSGLSRDLFPADYHSVQCQGQGQGFLMLPVKWLALEALLDHRHLYTHATDMWACGVTLWEVLSHGQQPYAGVDVTNTVTYLQQGFRLPQPAHCPRDVYSSMKQCWAELAVERPAIDLLLNSLQHAYTNMADFV